MYMSNAPDKEASAAEMSTQVRVASVPYIATLVRSFACALILMAMTDNLTGVWDGTFVQPGAGVITFTATLIESGGALAGSVTEPCMHRDCPLATHNSSIAGERSGSRVSFVKRYEPPGYGYNTVTYEGTVNAEATEIDGRWRLPGFSGAFLMVRARKTAQAVTTDAQSKEPVR